MKKNLMTKLMIATMCAFGTVTPVMCSMTPIHANDGQNTIDFSVTDMSATKTLRVNANVYSEPSTNGRVYATYGAGTQIAINGITTNGWYRLIASDPVYGGETMGYIPVSSFAGENVTYTTHVEKGYLALRNDACYDDRNIIGELYNGCTVTLLGEQIGNYTLVKVESTSGKTAASLVGKVGYVDMRYLI